MTDSAPDKPAGQTQAQAPAQAMAQTPMVQVSPQLILSFQDGMARLAISTLRAGCVVAAANIVARHGDKTVSATEAAEEAAALSYKIYDLFIDKAIDRRGEQRVAVDLRTMVSTDEHSYAGRTINLSLGGGLFRFEAKPPVGAKVQVAIEPIGTLTGEIVGDVDQGTRIQFGDDEATRRRIATFIGAAAQRAPATMP
ncbi:MAG: PilZ domain-containing protein [Alphaproteobacteria bacterium]|nr:PilZ domain-containing protein [Alphaproteobacteria bacterium]